MNDVEHLAVCVVCACVCVCGRGGDASSIKFPFGPTEADRLGAWYLAALHAESDGPLSSG